MKEKYIKSVNPSHDFKLIPSPIDEGIAYQKSSANNDTIKWFYSENNSSSGRNEIYSLGQKIVNLNKFNVELAAFAGNFFQRMLSGQQPHYYSCHIENTQEGEYEHVRACKEIIDFTMWKDCVSVTDDGIEISNIKYSWNNLEQIPLKGLTSMLVVGLFLGEADWADTNYGLIKGDVNIIRIDPGLSFNDNFLKEDSELIHHKLSNLLVNFIYEMDGENYFDEFKLPPQKTNKQQGQWSSDYDDEEYNLELDQPDLPVLINEKIKEFFCNEQELFETLHKILIFTKSDYFAEVEKISSGDYKVFWEQFYNSFHNRIEHFAQAALEFNNFKTYLFDKDKVLLNKLLANDPFNELPDEDIKEPLKVSNSLVNFGLMGSSSSNLKRKRDEEENTENKRQRPNSDP